MSEWMYPMQEFKKRQKRASNRAREQHRHKIGNEYLLVSEVAERLGMTKHQAALRMKRAAETATPDNPVTLDMIRDAI